MPKKKTIYKEIENFNDPWGGVYIDGQEQPFVEPENQLKNNQEWGYSRDDVEAAIKNKIAQIGQNNYGAIEVVRDNAKHVTVYFFKDKTDAALWRSDMSTYDHLVLDRFTIQESNPPQEWVLSLTDIKNFSRVQRARDETNTFEFTYNSFFNGDPSRPDDNGGGSATLIVNNEIVDERVDLSNGMKVILPVGKYCTLDSNAVTIIVSTSDGHKQTFTSTVQAVILEIAFNKNFIDNQHIAKDARENLKVRLDIVGIGGEVFIKVGNQRERSYGTYESGNSWEFNVDVTGLQTGRQNLEVWCKNEDRGFITKHLFAQFILTDANGELSSSYVALGDNPPSEVTLFKESAFKYYIIDPNKSNGATVDVEIKFYKDGQEIEGIGDEQTITFGNNHSTGIHTAPVYLKNNNLADQTLAIRIGIKGNDSVYVQRDFKVNSLDVEIDETSGYVVYYDLTGKNNDSNDVKEKVLTSTCNNITTQLRLSNNFKLDSEYGFHGGCVIPAGSTLTLSAVPGEANTGWKPFATDIGVNGNGEGRTIEMELSVGVCANQDIPVVSCLSNNTGFAIYPNRVEIVYGGNSVLTYFPEGERIKISIVIDGSPTNPRNTVDGTIINEGSCNLGYLYINGMMVRVFDYKQFKWNQLTAQNIVFGSSEGDVTLYTLRGYNNSLGMQQIMRNYAYDTPDIDEKRQFAQRNKVFITGTTTIDYNALKKVLNHTPVITWEIQELPVSKGQPKPCDSTTFINPDWPGGSDYACAPFKTLGSSLDIDGTSSKNYPSPYKNWAEEFNNSIELHLDSGWDGSDVVLNTDSEGEAAEGENTEGENTANTSNIVSVASYSITRGIGNDNGETKFVHKVNYASSEGIFNIHAMNMYQRLTLGTYTRYDQAADGEELLSKQQREQLHDKGAITYRKSLSGFPEIGLRKYKDKDNIDKIEYLSIYNLINNKKTGSMFGLKKVKDAEGNDITYKRYQIWEVDGNRNFFMKPVYGHTANGGAIGTRSNIFGTGTDETVLYYSRYPSKSPNNKTNLGEKVDFGDCVNGNQVESANNEIAALIELHNWIYSINPNVARQYKAQNGNFRQFTSAVDGEIPKVYGGQSYYEDSVAYREAKFIAEYQYYLHLSDCVFYFVFCEWILGMDSMDKNMSLFFDDLEDFYADIDAHTTPSLNHMPKLRIMLRDTDSINLFNNLGNLYFKYWHEWNDIWDPSKEVTAPIAGVSASGNPVYPVLNGTYNGVEYHGNPKTDTLGGEAVFNGRLSGLWDAITEFVPSAVEDMYNKMRQAGLRYDTMYAEYQKMRNYWCEALYNVDSMKRYVNTGSSNCDRAYGDKLLLSKYFYKYRERYMDSKFKILDDKKYIPVRLSNVPEGVSEWGIWMKHYTPMYASFSWSSESVSTARSIDGNSVYLKGPASTSANEDAHINDADTVTEIGFYTKENGIYVEHGFETMQGFWFAGNFDVFKRLKKFIWENPSAKENTLQSANFNFDKLKLLEELVMTYCNKYEQDVVIGSNIIRKIDFSGTPIKSITIPETETLTELHLPDSLQTLTLKNVPNLSTFDIAGISNLTTVNIENAGAATIQFAQALIANVGSLSNLTQGRIVIPEGTEGFTNEVFWGLRNAFGANVFTPPTGSENPNRLYIEVPEGVYITADKFFTDEGETVQFNAVAIPYSTTPLTYEMVGGTYDVNEGTYTSANGSVLNASTGELVTSSSTNDTIGVKAVLSPEKKSNATEIVSTKKKYPIAVNIAGRDTLRRAGQDFDYTVSLVYDALDSALPATPKEISWELGETHGYAHEVEHTDNSFTLHVDQVDSSSVVIALSLTLIYNNGTEKSQSKSITISSQIPEGAVDMGLSVLWAKHNIYIDSEHPERGNFAYTENNDGATYDATFFNFGNTGKDGEGNFALDTQGAANPTSNTAINYDFLSDYPNTVGYNVRGDFSGTSLDAATVHCGSSWRMPTFEQLQELFNNVVYLNADGTDKDNQVFSSSNDLKITLNGVKGIYMRSNVVGFENSKLFLPVCGRVLQDRAIQMKSVYGAYWTSTPFPNSDDNGKALFINKFPEGLSAQSSTVRSWGCTIRPVMY